MDYHGLINLTLIYSAPGQETSATHSAITATLFFNAPKGTWSVMIDHPRNLLDKGLIRAELDLPDGRRLAGGVRRPSVLGNAFELVEDAQPAST